MISSVALICVNLDKPITTHSLFGSLMSRTSKKDEVNQLIDFARSKGATRVKVISARDVVVDKRVRLKCSVPRCVDYDRNLMCPPNVMPVDEFEEILGLYNTALILQVEADSDSSAKLKKDLDMNTCEKILAEINADKWQLKLHRLVNAVEAEAFRQGYYLAAGLAGGECCLCAKCVTPYGRKTCRHPFQARPSMEAMGIDVIRTSKKAGMPVVLSSLRHLRWTGLVLLE